MGRRATHDLEAFEEALRIGEVGERALAVELFGTRIEVKRDFGCWRRPPRSGRLAIEFEQASGPSGLAISDAHRWAFEYDDECWLLLPKERVRAIAAAAYRQNGATPMGDNGNRGVLIPIEHFVRPVRAMAQPAPTGPLTGEEKAAIEASEGMEVAQ